uniref:PD-(D/E)XK endonuclease-like domain-containing protein n=1 Tax=Streptomyces sp. NBC_00003 TaxID=2903608 RepID=A0AAU2V7V5_9ACTN
MTITDNPASIVAVPDLWKAAHQEDRGRARSRQRLLGPSSIGLCRRRAGYEFHGTWPTDLEDNKHAAILGTWAHEPILRVLAEKHGAFTEIEVRGEQVIGHVDAYWPPAELASTLKAPKPTSGYTTPYGVVEDVKTKAVYALKSIERTGPREHELFQVHLYANMLRTGCLVEHPCLPVGQPLPVDVVRLRYVGRDFGDEFIHQQAYDEAITKDALAWADEVFNSSDPEHLPRDLDGPKLSSICHNCDWRTACWQLDSLPEGRAPQTILAQDHDSLVQTLKDYADAADIASPAKKTMAKARKVLDAAQAGIYGGFQLGWSGGNPRPAQPDAEAMVKILQNLRIDVPLLPGGRTNRTISVSRVTSDDS